VAWDFIHICRVIFQHRVFCFVYKPSQFASVHQARNPPASTPSIALVPWDVNFFWCALLAMVLSPQTGLTFVDVPSCALFESICACRLLPFVAGILIAETCKQLTNGVDGPIVEDLIELDTFLNREQKTKKAPHLFFLKGSMTSDAIHLEALGRRMLYLWNVLLTREIDSCADNIGAARTIFTISPTGGWCVDVTRPTASIIADFNEHASPRARARAFAISKMETLTTPRTFQTTQIIIASVSVWAIFALCLFNYFAEP
jgi:hypothetical protein